MIIGLGGISTAGKSKLSLWLQAYYSEKKICILCQDNFAQPTFRIPKINGHTDWEIPESIDFNKFYNKIVAAKKENDMVIAEGLFVFYEKRLLDIFNKKIYLTLSKATFLQRKSADLRWGNEPDWYKEHIWNSHHNCSLLLNKNAELNILSGENPVETSALINYLNE